MVQGPPARTGRRQWEQQSLTSAQTFPSRPATKLTALSQDAAQHSPPGYKVTLWQCSATRTPPNPSKSNASPALCPTAWPGQPDPQPAPLSLLHLREQYQNHQHMHSTSQCCHRWQRAWGAQGGVKITGWGKWVWEEEKWVKQEMGGTGPEWRLGWSTKMPGCTC